MQAGIEDVPKDVQMTDRHILALRWLGWLLVVMWLAVVGMCAYAVREFVRAVWW